jgi:hypothetical protein
MFFKLTDDFQLQTDETYFRLVQQRCFIKLKAFLIGKNEEMSVLDIEY